MSIFSSYKKIFLLGFIVVILIAIPFSAYIAQQRQRTVSKADASTTLSLEPASSTVKVGENLVLSILLDPKTGTAGSLPNQVSFVKLSIKFDPKKFTTIDKSLVENKESPNTLTSVLEDAAYDNTLGTASISLSIGADPTKFVETKTKIAILTLKSLSPTDASNPSSITFNTSDGGTQVLSIASSDKTSENVLSSTKPAIVTITSASTSTTPAPTTSAGSAPSSSTTSPAIPPASSPIGSSGIAPVCSSLNVDKLTTGTAPYSLTFAAVGSDSDGTISKISFNFGDSVENMITGGGIGTSTVSGQISHTYNMAGIYTAYAILTDDKGNLSAQQESCTKTITINSAGFLEPSPTIMVQEPLPQTGPGENMLGIGAIGVIFTIIGGILFFLL